MLAILCCFAFLAGLMDAMIGGGGLVQLPAFFICMPQLSLPLTLATNKTASFFGTSVAAVQYARRVRFSMKGLWFAVAGALLGAFAGASLVSRLSKDSFLPFILVILLLIFVYTFFKREFGLQSVEKPHSVRRAGLLNALTGLVIGFYDGLIGPGTGSFLIFAFVVLFGYDFLQSAARAKLINCVTNLAALTLFFAKGFIVWSIALPVAASNMAGNYLGSKLALKKGSKFIRTMFLFLVLALIARLGYDYAKRVMGIGK